MNATTKNGFVLLYTLLIISVSIVLVLSIVDSSLNELRFSGDELRSMTAFYAADSSAECMRYWQNYTADNPTVYEYPAFDTRSSPTSYSCGFGESFIAGRGSSESYCAFSGGNPSPVTYPTFRFDQFTATGGNAPCSDVSVTVTPGTLGSCNVSFEASGKNTCIGATNVVERTRWESWED